jgi:hypothetical protein
VAPRSGRIDTLKCREATRQRVFGRSGSRPSKHMRGGRKPNDWIGKPRRGERSREHRLGRGPNGSRSRTDSRSEQRSVVVGSRLPEEAPNGPTQTRKHRCARLRVYPVGGPSRSHDSSSLRWAGLGLMLGYTGGAARASSACVFGERTVASECSPAGATVELGATRATPELAETAREQRASRGVTAGREGKAL